MHKNNVKSYIYLIAGAFCISFSAIFVKFVNVDPVGIGFYRSGLGGLAILIITLVKRETLVIKFKPLMFTALAGLFFSMDLSFWHHSIKHIGPGIATILTNCQVFFMTAISIIFFKTRISKKIFIAVPAAMFGLVLLFYQQNIDKSANYVVGISFGLLAAICYTCYMLTLRHIQKLDKTLSVMSIMTYVCFFSSIIIIIEMLLLNESIIITQSEDWFWLILYGILCQGFGWIFIATAIGNLTPDRIGLILLIQPIFSFLWDIIIFKRPTKLIEYIGAVLIISAIYIGGQSQIANNKPQKKGK